MLHPDGIEEQTSCSAKVVAAHKHVNRESHFTQQTNTILHGLYKQQLQPTTIIRRMIFFLTTLLRVLAACASISFVAAQQNQTEIITTDELYAKITPTAAPPGFNVEGGSVFANYVNAVNNKQFFFLATGTALFEKPGSEPVIISWICLVQ